MVNGGQSTQQLKHIISKMGNIEVQYRQMYAIPLATRRGEDDDLAGTPCMLGVDKYVCCRSKYVLYVSTLPEPMVEY